MNMNKNMDMNLENQDKNYNAEQRPDIVNRY